MVKECEGVVAWCAFGFVCAVMNCVAPWGDSGEVCDFYRWYVLEEQVAGGEFHSFCECAVQVSEFWFELDGEVALLERFAHGDAYLAGADCDGLSWLVGDVFRRGKALKQFHLEDCPGKGSFSDDHGE